jgi:hypothetical protein
MIRSSKLIEENGDKNSDKPGIANPAKIVAASNQHATDLSIVESITRFPVEQQLSKQH